MFDTLYIAVSEHSRNKDIKELYYDDSTNKIVTSKPVKGIPLVDKDTKIVDCDQVLEKIVSWNLEKYKNEILNRAKIDALSYDELYHLLHYELNIFYDAANEIKNRIFQNPEKFGLRKIFHHSKTLAFSPLNKDIKIAEFI